MKCEKLSPDLTLSEILATNETVCFSNYLGIVTFEPHVLQFDKSPEWSNAMLLSLIAFLFLVLVPLRNENSIIQRNIEALVTSLNKFNVAAVFFIFILVMYLLDNLYYSGIIYSPKELLNIIFKRY